MGIENALIIMNCVQVGVDMGNWCSSRHHLDSTCTEMSSAMQVFSGHLKCWVGDDMCEIGMLCATLKG